MLDQRNILIPLVIWWCEGTKARRDKRWKAAYNYSVEVINSDPRIIKIFTSFLVNEMGVAPLKLRGQIQIHQGDNQESIEQFWSEVTGIPRNQFNKTIVREKGNKQGKNKGTFKIRVYDKSLYERLKQLLEFELKRFDGEWRRW